MSTAPVPPIVPLGETQQIGDRLHVIPDKRIEFVPNIGIVVGDDAALVIDTAMGPRNGERVLEEVGRLAGDLPLFLTLTHFHPEHGFAAQSFAGRAALLYNRAQLDELDEKGREYIEMFSGFGEHLAELLSDVELVRPQIVYPSEAELDLGGIRVELRAVGPAHTRGDQIVWLPDERVLFAGDLVEERFFPIFPDEDAVGSAWIEVLEQLESMGPETVVPGHGAVGGADAIAVLREYLLSVRARVRESGETTLEDLKAELDAAYRAEHPDWDNEIWIASAVESFHREH
jgi:glyoxylase-like metal-dependent hydrolase (beta-lactamase superfamily II)